MSFFFNPVKAEAKKPKAAPKLRAANLPIQSLRAMSCEVCPRAADPSVKSPKMKPSGSTSPTIYLLGSAPSEAEDEDNNHWTDAAGTFIYDTFGQRYMERHVRSNFITQCRGDQTMVEIECCRNRIIQDIEQHKPTVIVGVGDAPLGWATGLSTTALRHRGSRFAVKIGNHVCWFFSILYPNFVHKKKGYGKSEYQLALEHDIEAAKQLADSGLVPSYFHGKHDAGIQIVTGRDAEDLKRLERALTDLAGVRDIALDLETTGLRPYSLADARIITAAVGTFDNTVAFSIDHPEGWATDRQRRYVHGLFSEFLVHSGRKAAHNLAFELEWLVHEYGRELPHLTGWSDTMAMAHTIDERPGTKSLDHQCLMLFGFSLKALSNVDASRLLEYRLESVLKYNGLDTKWTNGVRDELEPVIDADEKLLAEYNRKIRLAPTLVLTETIGLPVNMDYAKEVASNLRRDIEAAEHKLQKTEEVRRFQQRFGTFSPSSPDHALQLMRDICKREEVKKVDKVTGTTTWTSDEAALSSIPTAEVPSAALILEHRSTSKLLGTYVEPVLHGRILGRDGRIRCKYSSMTAVTGRLASEDPNLQNWPKRKFKYIRGIISYLRRVYGLDIVFVACDYGQIEFRVVGMASEDANLVKYCWTGYDVHMYWAQRMLKEYPKSKDYIIKEWPEVLKAEDPDKAILKTWRQEAKNGWVFPQLFGSSARSCAEQLHLPIEVADDLAAEFWDEFRGVKKWQDKLLASYERNLYVETLGGRKRRGPMTKNEIINMPIQGTAADIVTEAMNACSLQSIESGLDYMHPIINVHDDLTFGMPDANLEAAIPQIVRTMCLPRFDYINVPLVVEVSIGDRWDNLDKLKDFRSDQLFGTRNPYA